MTASSLFHQLAAQGNQNIDQQIEEGNTDFENSLATFVARVENGDLSRDCLTSAMKYFNDPTASITGGTTPLAVGSGNGTFDELAAVQVLVNSDKLPIGVKCVIQRVLAEASDPMRIAVESDGTPSDLIRTQKANTDLTAETLSLKKDIQDSKDELAMAKQNPAGTMATAAVNVNAEAIHAILEKGKARQAGILVNPTYTLPEANYQELVVEVNKLRDASKVATPKPAPPKKKP